MKITATLTAILLALIGNTSYAQSGTNPIFTYNKDYPIENLSGTLNGKAIENDTITGLLIKADTYLYNTPISGATVTFDNIHDSNAVGFKSMVGLYLEDNSLESVHGVFPHLLDSNVSTLNVDSYGGFRANATENQKGDIIGFIQTGTKHTAGTFKSSFLLIDANYISSTGGNGPENNQTSVTGFSTKNAHSSSTIGSSLVINSAVEHEGLTYSAGHIVGIEAQGFNTLTGAILTINANAAQSGSIVGVHINGNGVPLPSTQDLDVTITLNHASVVSAENYDTLITDKNAGGQKTAYLLENTEINRISSAATVVGIQITSHELNNTIIKTYDSLTQVTGSGKDVKAIVTTAGDSSYIDNINSTIRVNNSYLANDSNSAILTMDIHQFGVIGEFGSEFEAAGVKSALGAHFFTDLTPDLLADGETKGKQESGLIYNNWDVHVSTDPHIYNHSTSEVRNEDNEVILAAENYTSKSVVGILVEKEASATPVNTEAVLNFIDGATLDTWIGVPASPSLENVKGLPIGDAIVFDVETMTLVAHDKTAQDLPPNSVRLRGDIVSRTDSRTEEIVFKSGEFDVTSDYWYVNNASIGDNRSKTTSTVTLSPSERFEDGIAVLNRVADLSMVDVLDIHVNSDTDFSQLVIVENQLASIDTLQRINVTLSTDIMKTEEFRLTLIDGDLLDTMGGIFEVTFEDIDNALAGPGAYALETIVVEYDGVDYIHNADNGWIVPLSGTAIDFIIKRYAGHDATIPEPSTATLSLLALAGLLARRRRRA